MSRGAMAGLAMGAVMMHPNTATSSMVASNHEHGHLALVTLIVALIGPPLIAILSTRLLGTRGVGIEVLWQILFCALAAGVIWVVVKWEHLPVRSIGLRRPDWSTIAWGLLLGAGILFMLPLVTEPVRKIAGSVGVRAGVARLALMPVWFRVISGATSGAVEEILYRGYAIERLATMTGRRWLGGAISAIVFGLAHVPFWGVGFALAADLPFGIVMTLFYLWRRDLAANILAHSGALVLSMLTVVP